MKVKILISFFGAAFKGSHMTHIHKSACRKCITLTVMLRKVKKNYYLSSIITIYVLLGWLDEGNNEFKETFLLFQVYVKIFFTFEAFFMLFLAKTKSRVKTNFKNGKNVKNGRDKHEERKNFSSNSLFHKSNQPKGT